jgi:hypothetical protein
MSGANDAVATFGFELDASSLTQGTQASAKALGDLKDKITGDTNSLREMQKALKNLQGGSAVNIAQFRDLKDKIAAQKATIASTTQSYIGMGGAFKEGNKAAVEASKGFHSLTDAARAAPGPLSAMGGKLSSIQGLFAGGAMAAGALAVAAAIVAVTAAAVAGAAALASYGIGVADLRRNELLHLEAIGKLRYGYMGLGGVMRRPADAAGFLQSQIDDVSGSVAIGREQIAGYAEDLERAGLRGGNLQAALKAMGTVAATQGEAAAGQFKAMAMGAAYAGVSVKKLADDVQARLGGIAAAQMLSLDVQTKKLKESFAMVFSGLHLDKLLAGLNSITELFRQNQAVGQGLKAIVDNLFGPLLDTVSGPASLLVKRFIQGIVIAALDLAIVIIKLRNYFEDVFANSTILKGIDLQSTALLAGKVAVGLFAASVLVAGTSLLAFGAFIMGPIVLIGLLGAAIYAGIKALIAFGPKALEAGANLIHGIVDGIKAGATWVVTAIENVAAGAMKAFKKKLGISSPSRVAMMASIEVPRGMALGLNAGRPQVHRAMQSLVEIPEMQSTVSMPRPVSSTPANASKGSGGGSSTTNNTQSPSVTIQQLIVQAKGDDARSIAEEIQAAIRNVFAEAMTPLGAPVP